MKIEDLPELATPAEVAGVIRASERYVQTQCKAGKFDCSKIAGKYFIRGPGAVQEFIEANKCRSETEGHTSTGEKTAGNGLSGGSKVGARARSQRAMDLAKSLTQRTPSQTSSSNVKKFPKQTRKTATSVT